MDEKPNTKNVNFDKQILIQDRIRFALNVHKDLINHSGNPIDNQIIEAIEDKMINEIAISIIKSILNLEITELNCDSKALEHTKKACYHH